MNWKIEINNLGLSSFCPGYWKNEYPSYGNANQAADMKNVDLTNPNYITQGPALSSLTGGTVNTLIKGMLPFAQSDDVCYGVGGNTLYKFGQDSVSSGASFPHTISGTSVEGWDVDYFNGDILYTYNTSTSGCVGKYDISGDSFNDTFNQALEPGVPHQSVVAGTDGVYAVTNKNKLTTYNGTDWVLDAFSTHDSDSVIVSVVWNQNRFQMAANKPYITTGKNKMIGSVYTWDGAADSWETRAEVKGEIGALYMKDGTTFVFYKENLNENVCTLGILQGDTIQPVPNGYWQGSLPAFYQITEYKNFLCWLSDNKLFCYGAVDPRLEPILFHLTTTTYSTGGGITSAFQYPLVASADSANYELAKFSGYKTDCYWKGLLANLRMGERIGVVDQIRIDCEKLASGCRADFILRDNKGNILWSDFLSYSSDGAVNRKDISLGAKGENARLEIDWSNGSSANPTKIKTIRLFGHTLK